MYHKGQEFKSWHIFELKGASISLIADAAALGIAMLFQWCLSDYLFIAGTLIGAAFTDAFTGLIKAVPNAVTSIITMPSQMATSAVSGISGGVGQLVDGLKSLLPGICFFFKYSQLFLT